MRLGLALGGGGARGAAHIGVLMELERLGIRPDLIVGTSIGGLVGALLSSGQTPQEMGAFFEQMNVNHLFGVPSGVRSLTGNRKLEQLLEKTMGRPTFADLPIPLAVVTVDLINRKEIVLDTGDLISAILATTAFPIVLPPVEREGLTLIDGGVLNNMPFDVARARGATHVIAVDLSHSLPYGTTASAPAGSGIVGKALAITQRYPLGQVISSLADIVTMQSMNVRLAITRPEVLLQPQMGTIGLFDFHRLADGISAGRSAAQAAEAALLSLASSLEHSQV